MAFDACMLACVAKEINSIGGGGRVEKIYQPEHDEIVLLMRTTMGGKRLLINGGVNNPRIHFTSVIKENPAQAPMFCMLLRKHLSGATLESVEQMGFERVVKLTFGARDEMGFDCKKHLIAEVMGKYSNLIFADGNMKIISSLKTVDFTTSSLRQVLPGMTYALPPIQSKMDPTSTDAEQFTSAAKTYPADKSAYKFITDSYLGISTALAREIVYRACAKYDMPLSLCDIEKLYYEFSRVLDTAKSGICSPCVIYDHNVPLEYCFTPLRFYGGESTLRCFESLSEALDAFYQDRDKELRVKQRAADIFRMLTAAESRIIKKLERQRSELADCERGTEYKKYGDLISSNIYRLSKKDKCVEVVDYENWNDEKQDYEKTFR